MKKLLVFLLTLVTLIGSAYALDLDVNVSSGNFYLFDAYGTKMDLSDVKVEEGLILMTADEWLDINCNYGSIRLAPDSILNVLSLDPAHPILYLVAGEASFFPTEDFYLEVYTPVSLVSTDRKGEFRIVTTAEEEKIYNMNNGDLRVLDAVSGIISEIPDLTWTDHAEGTIGDMDSADYTTAALFTEKDDQLHFFTDLGLPTLAPIEDSPLKSVLEDNWDIRVEPVTPRIPGAPVLDLLSASIDIPNMVEGLRVREGSVYDPTLPSVPEVELISAEIIGAVPAEPEVEVTDTEITDDVLIPAIPLELSCTSSIYDNAPAMPENLLVKSQELFGVPSAPVFVKDAIRYIERPGVPGMPMGLNATIHTPAAPELMVTAAVIRRGFVPSIPEFISSKSAPSFLIPGRPQDVRVKDQIYKEPLAAPIVKVYEDRPGFNSWDAETYRPVGSQASVSEKKTTPTLTSYSR